MDAATLERMLDQRQEETVRHFVPITVGVSNEAYIAECVSGAMYVVRIIRLQTTESARTEAAIQLVLAENGIGTPIYKRLKDGDVVGQVGSDLFTLSDFIPGQHADATTYALVESFGDVMARMHDALRRARVTSKLNSGQWLDPVNARADLNLCPPDVQFRLRPRLERAVKIFGLELPQSLIHGELATNNVFADKDTVTVVFDFETAQIAPRILDLAFTYLSILYDDELETEAVLSSLRAGYDKAATRSLTEAELAHFPLALAWVSTATATWCYRRDYTDYGRRFEAVGELPDAS